MKKRLMSTAYKLTLFISFMFLSMAAVQAAVIHLSDKPIEVKYLGTSDDAVFFNVSVDNPTGAKFSILVLDEDGSQLFQEIYTEKKFDKKFKLPKSEKHRLTFVVRNYKDADLKQTFEINMHYVEDVVVTKL